MTTQVKLKDFLFQVLESTYSFVSDPEDIEILKKVKEEDDINGLLMLVDDSCEICDTNKDPVESHIFTEDFLPNIDTVIDIDKNEFPSNYFYTFKVNGVQYLYEEPK